jgi:tetratricopeptide (TPR) repeat protein
MGSEEKMLNDVFSPAKAFVRPRLFYAEAWEHMLYVLEQMQALLVKPPTDIIRFDALEALLAHVHDVSPTTWAISHVILGTAYTELGYGASERNNVLELALTHYQQALQVLTEERFPGYWAIIQQGLCAVYLSKPGGDIADNLQQSLVRGQAALRVLTRIAYPFEWAAAHAYLGEAYRQATHYADLQELYSGRSVMQEQALRHLEAALQVYTMHDYPLEWARVQRFQSMIYLDRVQGKRNENLERSRSCLEAALHVFSHEFSPSTGIDRRM